MPVRIHVAYWTLVHSREDDPPAAVDVRVQADDPHVRLAREVGDLVSYLERAPPCAHLLTPRTAAVLAIVFRHRNEDQYALRKRARGRCQTWRWCHLL